MSQHRKVPGISQGPKEFTPSSFVPMQSPIGQPPPAVSESMQDLAMEIYARLVVAHLTDDRYDPAANPAVLKQLAQDAQVAAMAYFQAGFPNG